MSSLFGTLSIAVSGLLAEQGALNVTSNNVANANTPGYSRQRPVLLEGDPVPVGPLLFGSGVVLDSVQSVGDPILELRLNEETQQHSQLDTMVSAMQQIEVMFSGSSGNLGEQITNFFNRIHTLSTDPARMPLRQGVLTAAGNGECLALNLRPYLRVSLRNSLHCRPLLSLRRREFAPR